LDVMKKISKIAPGDWNFYIFIQNYQPWKKIYLFY
jgi:hypothetical protein